MCYHPRAARRGGTGNLSLDDWSAFERADTTLVNHSRRPLARVRGFLLPPSGSVFENSTACETSRLGSRRFGDSVEQQPRRVRCKLDVTFERKLEVEFSAASTVEITFFTESLILAQDERWRRA